MKLKLLIFALFLSTIAIGQSNGSLPKNNSFDDITRDSILSKLLDRKADKKRLEALRLAIDKYEVLVFDFEKLDRQRLAKESTYLKLINNRDSVIVNKDLLIGIETKKKRKRGWTWGAGGVLLGVAIKSIFF